MYQGGIWALKQRGKTVVSTRQSYYKLKGKVEGKPCEISFNYRFLLEGLLNISSGHEKNAEVGLELTNSEKPGVLRLKGDDSYLYLVMPIKAS